MGSVAIATQASCPNVLTLSYLADTLDLTYIAEEASCNSLGGNYHQHSDEDMTILEGVYQLDLSLALTTTLKSLQWYDVLVIYDNHDVYAHDAYLSRLGDEIVAMNGFIEMFEVNSDSLRSDISDILGYVMTADVYHQVLIVCSIECIEEILRMAVDIDKSKVEQELFSFAFKWLILADKQDLDGILINVQTLNHVTVITPPPRKQANIINVNNLM
ncbi:hypothetical protein LSH36_375g02037, partial [Paralvinella palmiformis]